MKLREILLEELETWPEGKVYAFQPSISTMTPVAFFHSSDDDPDYETIALSRIASNRGPDHKVAREEWEVAKIKSAPYFKDVAAILGEERAVEELLAVGNINYKAGDLNCAFAFVDTPQGFDFWKDIAEPSGANKLKLALNTITAALTPGLSTLQLQPDGSYSVRSVNGMSYFYSTDDLVDEYLSPSPTPKFDHWDLLQDRLQWIAKDSDGSWWAYENRPTLESPCVWEATGGDFHSLKILKLDIPCHWSRSLIERPAEERTD